MSKERYISNNDINELKVFINSFEGTYAAYYEFKYFQLAYLAVAKKRYPKIHQAILANENYWKVFDFIDSSYFQLILDYRQLLEEVLK